MILDWNRLKTVGCAENKSLQYLLKEMGHAEVRQTHLCDENGICCNETYLGNNDTNNLRNYRFIIS